GKIRSLSVIHPKSKKRSQILTNDFSSRAKEAVQIMFGRWSQENFFKKRFSICDFEKKRFFDLIKVVAHNIEQEMTKAFSSYYTRGDCCQVMRMVPERTTEVKLVNNDALLVKIKDLGTDRMNQLAQRFLTDVNNLGGKTLDKFRLKLSFDVEFKE
ncbi:MAG: hypothetical protein NWE87_01060, partial [Candidatus Bathyarchaeota archaeon]|nr:hypothetical protein [Candidatus Bathyarchaeota archaeon]